MTAASVTPKLIGDPTEGALSALAGKGGAECDENRKTSLTGLTASSLRSAEIPFDSTHKFMATFHRDGEQVRMLVKGAHGVLPARASRFLGAAGDALRCASRPASRSR